VTFTEKLTVELAFDAGEPVNKPLLERLNQLGRPMPEKA
jgi:hypothetical protein